MNTPPTTHLRKYAWLSIAAALITIALKTLAYSLTGSVGLLSDAMESGVNLVGAVVALAMLTIAARPADSDHSYGHGKAEYFSSGVEGALILVAALSIGVTAVGRLMNPQPLEQIGLGLAVSIGASLINLGVGRIISKAGKEYHSITLEADARHLFTDVWTSAGVVAGIGLVAITGWVIIDPIVALLVAANIVWIGIDIVRRSVEGLMDASLPPKEQEQIRAALDLFTGSDIQYHSLLTRRSGAQRFVSVHIVVPGGWSVHEGHQLLSRIESEIQHALANTTVITHLESREDPRSHDEHPLTDQPSLPESARRSG
jgi:cation diffusion facilitator family transporter